jgi:hypothetical protein
MSSLYILFFLKSRDEKIVNERNILSYFFIYIYKVIFCGIYILYGAPCYFLLWKSRRRSYKHQTKGIMNINLNVFCVGI